MTDVFFKKDIDQSEFFKNQREPKSKSERRLQAKAIKYNLLEDHSIFIEIIAN